MILHATMLAQVVIPDADPVAAAPELTGYGAIGILIALTIVMGITIIATTLLPKAKRKGAVKDSTYESGMEPIGDARRRFNISFYLVAMVFLLFDVELVFMYPWTVIFGDSATQQAAVATGGIEPTLSPAFLLGSMCMFFVILLVGYAYAWRKRVFTS